MNIADINTGVSYAGIAVTLLMAGWAIAMMFPVLFLSAANLFMWMALPAGAMFLAWYYVVGAGSEDYALVDTDLMQIETYKGLVRCGNCRKFDIIPLPKGNLISACACNYCGCLALEGVER